jgi:phage/plasmid-associated DNA primase
MLFRCSDVPDGLTLIGKKPDLAQIKLFEEGRPVGEIKLRRSYQVIPPSWKEIDGQRVDYKLLQEIPPTGISLVWLLQALQKIGISFTSKLEQTAAKLEGKVSEARKERALTDDQRARKYALSALEAEAREVAGSSEGTRNNRLNEAVFKVAQFIPIGLLSDGEIADELTKVARRAGLHDSEIESTIRSGLEAGAQYPRTLPEMEEKVTGFTLEGLTKVIGRKKRINALTGNPEPDPETGEIDEPKRTLSPAKAAMAVMDYMPLRISSADTKENPKLWRYNGSIWQPDGERKVKNLIDRIAGDLSYERGLQETLRRVRGLVDAVTFDSDPYLFPALDKVIDLRTGEARDYQPEDYLTFRYGAAWDDPEADYRPALWLLCTSLPDPRDVLTGLDLCTEAVIRQPSDTIVQLLGQGSNGKGLLERMISALVTDPRISSITLTEAKASRFGPGAVLGKDLWILSEVEDVKQAINLLKKVATGERLDSDQKYGERIQGKPHVLPILDCNNAFDFGDDSWGRKRRVIKLDFPFIFDYTPGTRRKDPHLEKNVNDPAALSGLLKIIAARAPFLIKSRRIYTRKRPEEMAEEYRRQQFSLHYFCEECLTTSVEDAIDVNTGLGYPDGQLPKLTTTALYNEYLEYCRLFNVPVPAEKGQVGKYIKEKFGVSSMVTRETNQQIRYYPGLWIAKSAKLARADLSLSYSSYSSATDKLQDLDSKNAILLLLATAATEEWDRGVLEEIVRMFEYIESCEDPQQISYEGYLKNAVVPVAAVAGGQPIVIPQKSPVADPVAAVAGGQPIVIPQKSPVADPVAAVLACRRLKKAIGEGITDPLELSQACGLPVCSVARFPGVNSIAAAGIIVELEAHRKEQHFIGKTKELLPQTSHVQCSVCGVNLEGKGRVERNGKIYCARPGCGYSERAVEVA